MPAESTSRIGLNVSFCFPRLVVRVAILMAGLFLAAVASAQAPDSASFDRAIAKANSSTRVAALEDLLARTPAGPLRQDALAWLAWEYHRMGRNKQAASAASELLTLDPENVLGLALASSDASAASSGKPGLSVSMAERGIARFEYLQRLRGMDDGNFAALKREVYGLLNATVGYEFYQRKDYVTARGYLRNAVAVFPNDPRFTYALGISDLNGHDLNPNEGYWMLARTVALSEGNSSGEQVSEYASSKYQDAGGSAAEWQKFVVAARAGGTYAPASSGGAAVASIAPTPSQRSAKSSASAGTASSSTGKSGGPTISAPPATLAERKMKPFPPGEPVSLGILIEADRTRKESRSAILQGLSDIVRRLRPKDEAFVLAFGQQLTFEQDLTQNYKLLEQAMDTIKPDSGNALYDAVGFAAGHLKRIAKNRNQALLVVSDGRNANSKDSSLQLASQIANVRIYCIGFGVDAPDRRYTIEALSGRTGGEATFISSPEQFEAAAQQLAAIIYGPDRSVASSRAVPQQ